MPLETGYGTVALKALLLANRQATGICRETAWRKANRGPSSIKSDQLDGRAAC